MATSDGAGAAKGLRWKFHVEYSDIVWAEDEETARREALAAIREEDGSNLKVRKCIDQHFEEHS